MNVIDKVKQKLHKEEIESVDYLDIYKFLGKWFEIARIGKFYDENLTNVFLTYTLTEKGKLKIQLVGNKDSFNGPLKSHEGRAKCLDQCNSRFEIEFLWPFKSDYIIMDIDQDYQNCLIGTSNRKHAWILSRQQFMNDELRRQYMKKLDSNGFNIEKLDFVPQIGFQTYICNQEEIKLIRQSNIPQKQQQNVVVTEVTQKKTVT